MSEPGYVVMPIQAGGGQDAQNDAMNGKPPKGTSWSLQGSSQLGNSQHGNLPSSVNQYQTGSLNKNTYGDNLGQRDQDHGGPLKKVIAQQDSLYKYLNWEDPLRTLGSYVGVWALKVGATGLGVMSVASFASRSFNSNSNSNPADRLRPKQYKKVPEATLNATLGDIHDFVQYAVVEAQRIIFGEDLNKTFAAFVGATALFWLIKVVSPFGLSVLGVSSIYLATLIASPRGRKAAREASAQAGNMANVATEKGKVLAQDGKNQAAKLSSQARDTAVGAQNSLGQTAQRGKESITDMSNRALDTAQSGKQSAADLSSRAMGTGSDTSRDASNTTRRLPDLTGNNLDRGLNTTRSELDSDRHYTTSSHVDPADRPAGQTVPRFGTATITKPTGVDYSDLESRNPYVDNPDIVTGSVNTSSHAAYSGLDSTNPFANDSRMGATDMEFDTNRVGNRAGNR
ncbi:hypothetical protein SCUP234_12960 [Seiridium cupressi]